MDLMNWGSGTIVYWFKLGFAFMERKNYRILQITKAKFPPEIRVVKEGLSFQESGYGSAVMCPPYDDQPERETWQGIEIFRPKILRDRSILDKLLDLNPSSNLLKIYSGVSSSIFIFTFLIIS